jgi:GntR family transcriptional regulator
VQIRRASSLPLHEQIRAAILAEIDEGRLRPGDQLPTEHDLAREMRVSVAPVRQALLSLASAGNVTRIKGRGTFVRPAALHAEISLVRSVTDSLRAVGVSFRVEVLRQAIETAEPEVATTLGMRRGGKVVALVRRIFIDADAALFVESFLPARRFGALVSVAGFEGGRSLYRTLADEFGTRTRSATSVLRVVRCDRAQSDALDLRIGEPALLVSSATHDYDGEPMEVARVLYRADLFSFTVHGREDAPAATG